MKADLSASWDPAHHYSEWPKYAAFDSCVNSKNIPTLVKDPDWAEENIASTLDKVPEARGAIWQSVLAVWYLQQIYEIGKTKLWTRYVIAWLVRIHRASFLATG